MQGRAFNYPANSAGCTTGQPLAVVMRALSTILFTTMQVNSRPSESRGEKLFIVILLRCFRDDRYENV